VRNEPWGAFILSLGLRGFISSDGCGLSTWIFCIGFQPGVFLMTFCAIWVESGILVFVVAQIAVAVTRVLPGGTSRRGRGRGLWPHDGFVVAAVSTDVGGPVACRVPGLHGR